MFNRFIVKDVFKLREEKKFDVSDLQNSEVRIMLLYCTQSEAKVIMENSERAGLTTNNYMWIVTQSVVGDPGEKVNLRNSFPVGMLGEEF